MTPIIKSGIIAHFTRPLKVDKVRLAVGERNKFKVKLEGEAITSDVFIELWKQLKERKRKRQRRTRKGREIGERSKTRESV